MLRSPFPSPLVPDDVTCPLFPLRAEAAHALPVEEGSLLRQHPHNIVSGCDLGQRVGTIDLHSSGTGTIHTETCQGDRQEAPKDTESGFHTSFYFAVCLFSFFGTLLYSFIIRAFSF